MHGSDWNLESTISSDAFATATRCYILFCCFERVLVGRHHGIANEAGATVGGINQSV